MSRVSWAMTVAAITLLIISAILLAVDFVHRSQALLVVAILFDIAAMIPIAVLVRRAVSPPVPQALMLVPALLVLVPGSLSYESVLFAFQHNISSAFTFASNAMFAAVQLVAGLLLSQLVFPAKALQMQRGTGRQR